jgi:hypothetical protein
MGIVGPSTAPIFGDLSVRRVCEAAARTGGFEREQTRLALGAISNLYCLSALDRGAAGITMLMTKFSSEVAEQDAILLEIERAVAGVDRESAEALLSALACGLDETFAAGEYLRARLLGFGLLEAVETRRSTYRLTVELPLAREGAAGTQLRLQ